MKIAKGLAMSDGLNRKNHFFSLKSILNAYEGSWQQGVPSNLNHDRTKLVGWHYVTGIYLEPGKAYVTNAMYIPENESEYLTLQKRNNEYLYKEYYLSKKEKFDALKSQLGSLLTENAKPAPINCIAYEDESIVLRVFPEIAQSLHKGLIDIRLLEPILPGLYKKGSYILFAHRFFRRNCSLVNTLNDSFLERFDGLRDNYDLSVQIALDLSLIGLPGTEHREFEYQYWWGPHFNEDLSSIPNGVTKHNNEHYDNLFSNICFTEFGWYVQDSIQTFECEEVNDAVNITANGDEYYGCRFIHSMINPETSLPDHLDGAIRAYTEEKMVNRLDISIDKSQRDTWYTKLWRIDRDMPVGLWKELITHYYRDNGLVGEYFNGKDDTLLKIVLEDNAEEKATPLSKYIPVEMNAGDGIRAYFRYIPYIRIENYDAVVRSNEFMLHDDTRIKVMESETITVLKLLKKYGVNIRIPYIARIGHEDTVYNFPDFVCRDVAIARIVQKVFVDLCNAWNNSGDDRLISYSIIVNYANEAVHFSFAGHVADFACIYTQIGVDLPDRENLNNWIEMLYKVNNKYPKAKLQPGISNIMSQSGDLRFKRAFVPEIYLRDIKVDSEGLTASFTEKDEIVEELIKNKISIAPIFHIERSRCSKCQKDYTSCNCVKFIDDAYEEILKGKFLGATWTNRHA